MIPSEPAPTAERWTPEVAALPVAPEEAVRFQAGDPTVFSALYHRFHRRVQNFIHAQVHNAETAEDIAQEAFLKAYRFCASYNPAQSFSAWIYTIAQNSIIDWQRKQMSSRLELGTLESHDVESEACPRPSAEKMLVLHSYRRTFSPLLRKLTGLQRRVLFLTIVRDFTHAEVAARLGLSPASVKCALYRARLVLGQAGAS